MRVVGVMVGVMVCITRVVNESGEVLFVTLSVCV